MNMPLFSVVVTLLVSVQTIASAVPVIQAPWGSIQGVEVEGDAGRKMNGYLGIPYALPPVGELRFERPQPHPGPGQGQVFVADTFLPACVQIKPALIDATRETSEDCLMLNVYVPTEAANSNTLYPVMFFIHGGGFSMGDAPFYKPSKMVVDGQVIVVTIQYRLGPFGFFHSADDFVPGNQGLWDQNLALRWVKDNIRAFGGDPDLITVFGESAGSMSTSLQMLSPESKGLMKRAILQSGTPQFLTTMTEYFKTINVFQMAAEVLECEGDSTEEQLQCMKRVSAEDFFNKTMQLALKSGIGSYFFPIVDGEFIPRDVKELALDEQYVQENGIGDIDVMVGVNNREGSLLLITLQFAGQPFDLLSSPDYYRNVMDQCFLILGLPQADDALRKTVEFFYRGAELDSNQSMDRNIVADMYGDCLMNAPILEWAHHLAASPHTANRYLYMLDHLFECNNQGPYPGAHHGDDLILQFDNDQDFTENHLMKALNKTALTKEELPLGDKFVQILTTFAKTGNPSGPVREDIGGDWPPFTADNEAYLSISQQPRMVYKAGPYRRRAALWNKLIPQMIALSSQSKGEHAGTKDQRADRDEL